MANKIHPDFGILGESNITSSISASPSAYALDESINRNSRGQSIFIESDLENFGKWHGMSEMIDKIGKAIDFDNRFRGKGKGVNGWAILSCVIGVDEVFKRMEENLKLTVLVCGLLLNSALGLILTPPPKFVAGSPEMTAYISFSVSAIGLYLFCILLSIQFLQSLNACARDADKWRVILSLDRLPTATYLIFTAASLCLALAIGFCMLPNYSQAAGYTSAAALIFVCGVVSYAINAQWFLKVAHVKHGWYEKCNKEYNVKLPFSKLTVLADIDRRYKKSELCESREEV